MPRKKCVVIFTESSFVRWYSAPPPTADENQTKAALAYRMSEALQLADVAYERSQPPSRADRQHRGKGQRPLFSTLPCWPLLSWCRTSVSARHGGAQRDPARRVWPAPGVRGSSTRRRSPGADGAGARQRAAIHEGVTDAAVRKGRRPTARHRLHAAGRGPVLLRRRPGQVPE